MSEVVFAFEDPARQTFLAVNRAGDGYHVVTPAEPDDVRVTGHPLDDGSMSEPKVAAGDLVCSCKGGRFHGSCYVVEAARQRLTIDFTPVGAAAGWEGAGAAVEAARG